MNLPTTIAVILKATKTCSKPDKENAAQTTTSIVLVTCDGWKTDFLPELQNTSSVGRLERETFPAIPCPKDTIIPLWWRDCEPRSDETRCNTVPDNQFAEIERVKTVLRGVKKKKARRRQTVQAAVQMYMRWGWTCTAIDEQTLCQKLQGTRTPNPQSAGKRPGTNSVPGGLDLTPLRCPPLCGPGVDRNIKKRALSERVVVVSCSTSNKVEGNKRSVTNCGRKAARKDGWEFLGAARHWGVSATNVFLPPSKRINLVWWCYCHGHLCWTTLGNVSFHTPTKTNSRYVRNREINSRHPHVTPHGPPCVALAFHHTLKAHLRMRVNGKKARSASNRALPLYWLPVFLKWD